LTFWLELEGLSDTGGQKRREERTRCPCNECTLARGGWLPESMPHRVRDFCRLPTGNISIALNMPIGHLRLETQSSTESVVFAHERDEQPSPIRQVARLLLGRVESRTDELAL
jgi:hypothetical protein